MIISNIGNKSRAIRSDIRIARDRLLHEAMSDLQDMRAERFVFPVIVNNEPHRA